MTSLQQLSGDELLNFVVEYVYQHEATLTVLSVPLQTVYFVANFEAEFYNGGIQQFFTNSSGKFAWETVASFARIGAHQIAALVAEGATDTDSHPALLNVNNRLHKIYPTNDDGNVGNQLIGYLEANRAAIPLV
ncbi:MAG: DMP19 family protein [Janthinobacterium lividum]